MESNQNVNHLNLLKKSASKKQNSSHNLISDSRIQFTPLEDL